MKYKTLFRLALKLIGVCFFFLGLTSSVPMLAFALVSAFSNSATPFAAFATVGPFEIVQLVMGLLPIGVGWYLFFKGEWIVNKAIPSNKPYCHECGYLLKDLAGDRCPECDTPFRPASSAGA